MFMYLTSCLTSLSLHPAFVYEYDIDNYNSECLSYLKSKLFLADLGLGLLDIGAAV